MIEIEFDKASIEKLTKKIEQLAAIDRKRAKEIRNEARKIATENYVKRVKQSIKDFPTDIVVVKKNGTRITIPKGTLRRSIGTWQPKGSKTVVAAGPRSGNFRRLPENRDGWFAHFVEYGNFPQAFGGKKVTANTGVFQKAKAASARKIQAEMVRAMSAIISREAQR
jgi:hypothetical protein